MSVERLDHIGIVVSDLEQAVGQYETVLGVKLHHIEDYGEGLLRIAFLPLANVLLELIQPLRPGSAAWDYLQKNGGGIEHMAFRVSDLNSEIHRVIKQGVPVRDETPRPGAGNTQICFLNPVALSGALGEFVGDVDEAKAENANSTSSRKEGSCIETRKV
ncbi:VOC family protein [Alicyclobacillus dauci]|uniref:VOC family protein n=1 Tax=Alicyclobacillus dauci TaxID=1475485 RepID=A0ABY6YYL5_9BACL|nr:VOC family protein [Alicyclobacillus dauci]WAH35211.1 VOC family protein [Alicyclobacillus dauci]